MSGIYIPGMEMPKNCASCDVACAPYLDRGLDGLLAKICHGESRRNDCPLIHVPDHGRLIDAGYVMNNMRSEHPYVQNAIRATISVAPTIIPAEEGET